LTEKALSPRRGQLRPRKLALKPPAPTAYARFKAGWPALRRSLLLLMQHTRNVAVHLRGRAALAGAIAVEGAERRARLGVARASAARLRRRGGWGGAMAALLTAGVERVAAATRFSSSASWAASASENPSENNRCPHGGRLGMEREFRQWPS
jgi:hypothetical protein